MKHFNTLMLVALSLMTGNSAIATEGVITLDLTNPSNPETLNFEEDGAWDRLYEDTNLQYDFFEAQIFMMSHLGWNEYNYWDGFAPCTSTDMTDKSSYTAGCMAGGGIALDENGNVITDDNGNVTIDPSAPYLIGYYSTMMSADPSCKILFNDGQAHEVVGVYVTNFPTSFYNCLYGNGYARAFVNGDKFTLTIHGIASDQSEKTIEVDLVKYEDGMLQAIRGWKFVDLSSLGAVESLYFTMSSTDSNEFGMVTSAYFCLDKLMVKSNTPSSIGNTLASAKNIIYDRDSKELILPQSEFAIIYNAAGQKVMAKEGQRISVSSLDNGLYLVKTADCSMKFIK